MAKEWAKTFYNSKAWIRCRTSYIAERTMIDGGMCEECQKNPGYIVHHRIMLTPENISDPEVTLNHEYMEYVCKDCHDAFEGHGAVGHGKVRPLCMFDGNGQPISLREVDTPPPKNQ